MSEETVAVVGATGMLGEPVARQLLRDGFAVRLLVRDVQRAQEKLGPDFSYVPAELASADSLRRALEGCAGVHVSLQAAGGPEAIARVEHQGTTRLAAIAAEQGLSRLSFLSGMYAGEAFADAPAERAKAKAEEAIRRSGVPFTIFKPSYFMETLPRHVQGRYAVVLGRQPHPLHMVAAGDYARMVSSAYRKPEAANKSLYVFGPEAVTISEALRLYTSLAEPGKRVMVAPLPLMSALDTIFMGRRLARTLALMKVMQRVGEVGDPSEANRLLGAPATTLHSWCELQRRGQSAVDRQA
ncbi:MAG: NAD(P)H-binding protein [Deinococcota bacterium]|nr:NAD(P)H-binding protein [Deinococcota bacterium]